MGLLNRCYNCGATEYVEPETCGYCGLPGCQYCMDGHEADCDRNPENDEEITNG